jgi:hypothetical protein
MSDASTTVIDNTDPEIKKLYNIPYIGSFFKKSKKSKKTSSGLTGIKMLDNLFVEYKSEDSTSNYYSSPDLEDGETVNEKIVGMPVIDAYITLFGSLVIISVTIFAIVFIIHQLTK